MIWQGEWKGWCYSRRRCPRGCPSPWLWGQFGPTPLASLRHTESWPGSDFGFPASSPSSPGTCGWAREAFCPFSGQGTIWQLALLRTPALGTERAAYHSQPVWGTYEYADRGWSWLAAPPTMFQPLPNSVAQKSQLREDLPEMPSLCLCLKIFTASWKFGDWITHLLPLHWPPASSS